jgi:hypothetical protein
MITRITTADEELIINDIIIPIPKAIQVFEVCLAIIIFALSENVAFSIAKSL